jgi:hypothetical protein
MAVKTSLYENGPRVDFKFRSFLALPYYLSEASLSGLLWAVEVFSGESYLVCGFQEVLRVFQLICVVFMLKYVEVGIDNDRLESLCHVAIEGGVVRHR